MRGCCRAARALQSRAEYSTYMFCGALGDRIFIFLLRWFEFIHTHTNTNTHQYTIKRALIEEEKEEEERKKKCKDVQRVCARQCFSGEVPLLQHMI